ncbi:MAG: class I SAM-dependent methyltransferase [Salinivirgaceae bacterium]
MNFYTSIADAYEAIFPLNPEQVDFVTTATQASGNLDVFDVGCGTGQLAQALAERGHRVTGIDLNPEMIARAVARNTYNSVSYYVQNMLELDVRFKPQSFDAVLCFGNTLVHLPDEAAVGEFCSQAFKVLKPGGRLLIQIINYDRILNRHIKGLPTIENDKIEFVREYHYLEAQNRIDFRTRLTLKASGKVIENSQLLLPLRKQELMEQIGQAGFVNPKAYGGFKQQEWSEDTQPLVIDAQKE